MVIDPKGIIVGELDGKPMSFASVLRYDNTYCHGGIFYVEPKYRGSSCMINLDHVVVIC